MDFLSHNWFRAFLWAFLGFPTLSGAARLLSLGIQCKCQVQIQEVENTVLKSFPIAEAVCVSLQCLDDSVLVFNQTEIEVSFPPANMSIFLIDLVFYFVDYERVENFLLPFFKKIGEASHFFYTRLGKTLNKKTEVFQSFLRIDLISLVVAKK